MDSEWRTRLSESVTTMQIFLSAFDEGDYPEFCALRW